jgi:hypothetical protein
MSAYIPNRTCHCPRCRARGLMGPGILITLGVLFLLDQTGIRFHETFPVLLIVIGVMLYLGRSATTEGHMDVRIAQVAPAPPPPVPADQSRGPEVNS